VLACLKLTVFDDHTRLAFSPPIDRCIERIQVFESPLDLQARTGLHRYAPSMVDDEKPTEPEPTQETPTGHEIPVPTRDDVLRDLAKAAKVAPRLED